MNVAVFTGGQIFVASYLVAKHGEFNFGLFTELNMYGMILSALFTTMAAAAIWKKDHKEFYRLADNTVSTRFRDYWPVFKKNRPLQMLVVSASTDKLAGQMVKQPAVLIMVFGIIMRDYELSGTISLITVIPTLIITFLGVSYARKTGLKSSFVKAIWIGIISFSLLIILFLTINPSKISLSSIDIVTVIFLVPYTSGGYLY